MNDSYYVIPPTEPHIDRFQRIALILGLLGAVVCVAGLFIAGFPWFFQSYLYAYMFWLGLALGSMAIAMLHYLVGGNWGIAIRRIVEAASKTIWIMAILFIPLLLGIRHIYSWTDPQVVASDVVLQHKSAYLNIPFFMIRAVLYFAIWIGLTYWLLRWSRRLEYNLDLELRRRFQRISAIGLILYVLTMSFASTDWIMSLQPHWFSTIFGLLIITTQVLAGLAFSIAILPLLVRNEPLSTVFTPGLSRDLGALLLAAVMFWAYIAFSQFLIIWAGNIPREVTWYIARSTGGWIWPGLLVIFAQFFLPFFVLLSLRAKRDLRLISALATGIIAVNLIYYFWDVIPAFRPSNLTFHWLDFVTPVAIGGLWIAAFFYYLKRTPILFLPEPRLEVLDHGKGQTTA